ncbi:hypothetical protein DUNSADRAFT_1414 [Dunaliella salina]|uniref:Uncharacterized protein n=1 Tax=Dunaliella salina TaxID=3046 RepID=A0ABQ7GXB5_DUNSA|nr:hypothetical protein DUNSADRAFT_1414 [Dunaliella salina]|eukprot:KAF5839187.1 hypothetical protein DUNSADRAFT_1414 [Dunaliella salina]
MLVSGSIPLPRPCLHSLHMLPHGIHSSSPPGRWSACAQPVARSSGTGTAASAERLTSNRQSAQDLIRMVNMRTLGRNEARKAEGMQGAGTSQPSGPQKSTKPRKRKITDEENEAGLRWLARCLMGVYQGFGQTEEEALQELRRLRVRCYSRNASTRRFFVEDGRIKGSFSRPHLVTALNLQLNPGCSGSTVQKQFTQTIAKMSPEQAERGMRWLAEGLTGAFIGMGETQDETVQILKKMGVACTCIGERGTKRYFSIFGRPGRFVGRPAVVQALNLKVLDRAKAAKYVGGSVASTFDVNEQENEGALVWLAGHIMLGSDGEMGETLEEVVDELKRRKVRCVRIEKRATNPRRFFQVGDDPKAYPGLSQTLEALGF